MLEKQIKININDSYIERIKKIDRTYKINDFELTAKTMLLIGLEQAEDEQKKSKEFNREEFIKLKNHYLGIEEE